ncbi:helix-turn-helix transcriptional regulator [Micromonospora sp. ATA32]|nr:helix-turn-helix transcriptional regulator [Micromonospora sp. ATA32]
MTVLAAVPQPNPMYDPACDRSKPIPGAGCARGMFTCRYPECTFPDAAPSQRPTVAVPQPGDRLARFGQRVRALREAAGLRQADLAAKVGLARTSIANIEAGRQDTTVTVLLALADTLDTTVGALLGDEPGQPTVPISLLSRIAGQQRRIAGTLAEAGELVLRLSQDADEMRARMDALGKDQPRTPTPWERRAAATGGGPCSTCGEPFYTHVCLTCSPDSQTPGPGCHNCRRTGMDQTPCLPPKTAPAERAPR